MSKKIVGYKGFDKDMKCRGFQFAVGETYTHKGPVEVCGSGFHACTSPWDVWSYYGPFDSTYATVEASGEISRQNGGDTKFAAASITVKASLKLPEFIAAAIVWLMDVCKATPTEAASGYYSNLAASGNSSKLAASGYYSNLAASGNSSKLAASGYYSKLAASGDSSNLAASGYSSKLAASGDSSNLAASGYSSIASAIGKGSTASAGENGWIVLAAYDSLGRVSIVKAAKVGGPEGVKANVFYRLDCNGDFIEVKQ